MRRLVIHIGYPKTGTTMLQQFFAANPAGLAARGVLYPQTGKGAVNSCWDWWGYDDAIYAKKSAPQMTAIMAMMNELSRGAPAPAKR